MIELPDPELHRSLHRSLQLDDATELATGRADADGRVASLGPDILEPGDYRLAFEAGVSFVAASRDTCCPRVTIDCTVLDEGRCHVPLLSSPFAYSPYRGS
jgi:5-hydroxyisourate hydrolase